MSEIGDRTLAVIRDGSKLLMARNGGGAPDALHIAGEFCSRLICDRIGRPAILGYCAEESGPRCGLFGRPVICPGRDTPLIGQAHRKVCASIERDMLARAAA